MAVEPIIITDKEMTEYQAIYKKQFGKEISREDALEQGHKLLRLMDLIYKPITRAEYNLYSKNVNK